MTDCKVQPKSRPQLVKETVIGVLLALLGIALLAWVTIEGHENGLALIWVAVGLVGTGLFWSNKKLAAEWMAEVREFLAFWKGR